METSDRHRRKGIAHRTRRWYDCDMYTDDAHNFKRPEGTERLYGGVLDYRCQAEDCCDFFKEV